MQQAFEMLYLRRENRRCIKVSATAFSPSEDQRTRLVFALLTVVLFYNKTNRLQRFVSPAFVSLMSCSSGLESANTTFLQYGL